MNMRYIVQNKVSCLKHDSDRVFQQSKQLQIYLECAVCRINRLYEFHLGDNYEVKHICCIQKAKKRKTLSDAPVSKHHIQIPLTVDNSRRIENDNGSTYWKGDMENKVKVLLDFYCFEFRQSGNVSTLDYIFQNTTLHTVFDVK